MKRAKYEHLHSTINQYLKRRQFTDGDGQKKECRYQQQLPSMALKGCTSSETTTDNTLAFTSISGDALLTELQYSRLKSYLTENTSLFGSDSILLLFPVFVHLYIEMLNNGHKPQAHKFFSRHSSQFRHDSDNQAILDQLVKLYSKADMISCKEVQAFKDIKYKIKLSKEKFEALHRYLRTDDNMMILQVVNNHLQLEVAGFYSSDTIPFEQVRSDTECPLGLNDDRSDQRQSQPVSPAIIPDNKVVTDDQALSSLKQVIKDVREGPPGLPSICFYTFLNAYQGLCSTSISPNQTYLSGGFEDSSVKLWRLQPGTFPAVDNSDGPTMIRLGADYCNTGLMEEETDDKKGLVEKECVDLKGHTGCVYQARFTWDSNFLLTCSDDTTVRLWDIEHQTNAAVFKGHNYSVWDLDTSTIGDYFATCSYDQTAKLWSTERTFPLRSFIGHTYDVDCVKFHPNANYIVTGSGDKTVRMWSIQEGKCVRLLSGHKSSILALAVSPNGMMLASAGEDRRVRVWDLRTGSLFKEFRGHTDTIYALAFNQSTSLLASGGLDNCIRVWDLRKNTCTNTTPSDNHNSTELMGAFPTKSTPVLYLNFTIHNILQAAGAV